MKFSVFFNRCAALAAGTLLLFAPALAEESETQENGASKPLVVMELFTSQGCYSCPAADKLVDEVFTKNPNLLPLEMHVDYWDDLVYGLAGVWKDPFSDRQFSERQFAYNRKMRRAQRRIHAADDCSRGEPGQRRPAEFNPETG